MVFCVCWTETSKKAISGPILMLFGPMSTNLRSRNTNLVKKIREVFCMYCKLVLKTGNFGCFCTFLPLYFCRCEWKKSRFFIRIGFSILKLVDIGPKSIKIGPEMAFLEVSVQHAQKTMFACNLYKIKIGTFASSDIGFVATVAGRISENSQRGFTLYMYTHHICSIEAATPTFDHDDHP